MTDEQAAVYAGLGAYAEAHPGDPHPTGRSLADFMEKDSDAEVRGHLEALIELGYGGKYRNKAEQVRYCGIGGSG